MLIYIGDIGVQIGQVNICIRVTYFSANDIVIVCLNHPNHKHILDLLGFANWLLFSENSCMLSPKWGGLNETLITRR